MAIPEGYNHKATSQSFSGTETVVVYYSTTDDLYLVQIGTGSLTMRMLLTKEQLALVVHAGTDVIEMDSR